MKLPNIIYIYADDLGRGMLSCFGQRHFRTPNIDRIAAEGIRFTRAYGCAFCAPARASLLLGAHDCHRGGWTFTQGGLYHKLTSGALSQGDLQELIHTVSLNPGPDEVFLPQIPREAGYVTAQIGKLEWGFATTDRELRRHGWDYHYGYYDHAQCHGFYPRYVFENGTRIDIAGNTRDDFGRAAVGDTPDARAERADMKGRATYSQDLFDAKILEFLRQNANRPFFLFHPSQLPHGPTFTPEIDSAVRDNPVLSEYEKEYASMVLRLDRTVGLILDELDRLGLAEDTVVAFSSDNGHESEYYAQPGRSDPLRNLRTGEAIDDVAAKYRSADCGDVFDGNDGMAGRKRSSLEGGVRLPFLVRWPAKVAPGRQSDLLMANYDFLPTVAELLGARIPEGKDGLSYLPELLGRREAGQTHDCVVFASHLGPAIASADGWKLRKLEAGGRHLYQLYDLNADPAEARDVVNDHPEVVRRLGARLLRECDGNFLNGTPQVHQVWMPGLNFHGPDCHWDIA